MWVCVRVGYVHGGRGDVMSVMVVVYHKHHNEEEEKKEQQQQRPHKEEKRGRDGTLYVDVGGRDAKGEGGAYGEILTV